MIPLRDVVPTRTQPLITIGLCAAQAITLAVLPPGPAAIHLVLNIAVLWNFGNTLEDRMGHGRYVAFYVLCGGVATFTATIGATSAPAVFVALSGGVAGVIGAYLVLYPASRLVTLLPVPGVPRIVEVPAVALACAWFVLQLASRSGTTAVAALGAGAIAVRLFRRRERMRVEWWNELTERR
jgi:membrane associated rhomboid family serine protease